MFGIGFTEILLISIIAILFLGPDKLPETMVQIAKFIKGVKKTVGDAKSALDEEMRIADLKDEALNYKQQLDSATDELKSFKNIGLDDMDDLLGDTDTKETNKPAKDSSTANETPVTPVEAPNDTVTFKKKSKKKKKPAEENDTAGKTKVAKKNKDKKSEDKA
ncbi:Sec-independent protein translocase protein TatB [Sulfurovum sp. NBC37-1]|uniref:Sec-independent protein translocase protein TatB n=1 Tax=Sulfurovum sp. (strain NBC37-1) TaxID=387093 RepID=UPI00015878EE|nr:Sec-independent protein translocase protein TatB [Sulfurovum sp. NBC37-1]BAF71413.1 twin-arginine translocation system component TatB [Sulfurovum sp. NBC37-1]